MISWTPGEKKFLFWFMALFLPACLADLEAVRSKAELDQMLTTIVWDGEPGPAFPVIDVTGMMLTCGAFLFSLFQCFRYGFQWQEDSQRMGG